MTGVRTEAGDRTVTGVRTEAGDRSEAGDRNEVEGRYFQAPSALLVAGGEETAFLGKHRYLPSKST